MKTQTTIEKLLSARDIAEKLSVHVKTVRFWGRTGKLPRPRKIGKLARWTETEVAAALAAMTKYQNPTAIGA